MKGSAHNSFQAKQKRLLQLYSEWQETRNEDVQKRCLGLLREIMSMDPGFNLRGQFQKAF